MPEAAPVLVPKDTEATTVSRTELREHTHAHARAHQHAQAHTRAHAHTPHHTTPHHTTPYHTTPRHSTVHIQDKHIYVHANTTHIPMHTHAIPPYLPPSFPPSLSPSLPHLSLSQYVLTFVSPVTIDISYGFLWGSRAFLITPKMECPFALMCVVHPL